MKIYFTLKWDFNFEVPGWGQQSRNAGLAHESRGLISAALYGPTFRLPWPGNVPYMTEKFSEPFALTENIWKLFLCTGLVGTYWNKNIRTNLKCWRWLEMEIKGLSQWHYLWPIRKRSDTCMIPGDPTTGTPTVYEIGGPMSPVWIDRVFF